MYDPGFFYIRHRWEQQMNPSEARRGLTKKRVAIVLSVTALLVFTVPLGVYFYNGGSVAGNSTGNQCLQDPGLCITATLTVMAYHSGQSTPYYNKSFPNDPIVDGFNKWLIDVFDVGQGLSEKCTYGSYCFVIGMDTVTYCTAANPCGAFLEIGTTAGTARSDTALNVAYTPSGGQVEMASTATNPVLVTSGAANPATCNTGTTDSVTGISGSQPITGSVTIQEAGLFLGYTYTSTYYSAMFSHDTISPGISASNGDTVTVAYTINLSNTGMTTNLCNFLAGLFAGNIAGGTVTVTLTQVGGSTGSFYVWCTVTAGSATSTQPLRTTGCVTASPSGKMGIGTGTTPFTPSSLMLTSQVGTRQQITAVAYVSPTDYWTTTFTEASTNTIGEIGSFLTLSGNDYMFFATLLSPTQTETATVAYGQTIRLGD